jgi:hypothetical protein
MRKINLDDVMNFFIKNGDEMYLYHSDFRRNVYKKTERGEISIFEGALFTNFSDLKSGTEPLDLIMYLKDCSRPQAQGILNKIYKEVKNGY